MSENFITLDRVSKSYGADHSRHMILDDISVTVKHGESVAILGHSGCGKSTLLNLVSGIDKVDSGKVIVDGIDLTALSENHRTLFRRKHIGFVYQSFNLIQTLTAIENVQLPLQLNGYKPAEILTLSENMLDQVGLSDRLNSFPDQLSGGEQQRVAIARAMVHSPSLVLADEHTGNLDADTGREMIDLFANLAKSQNLTVIMVTHSLSIAQTADRIIRFIDGRLQTDNNFDASSLAW